MPALDSMQGVLLAAVSALAGVIGVMWVALQAEIRAAKADCDEDRKKLWELVRIVGQLDRRRDWVPPPSPIDLGSDEHGR